MKKTCSGCKALVVSGFKTCELGKRNESNGKGKYVPLEDCRKPRTNQEMSDCLKEERTK